MNWDVMFLLRGYPKEYRFKAPNYFMAAIDEGLFKIMGAVHAKIPEASKFFNNAKTDDISLICFRIETNEKKEALKVAEHYLDGIIDGISVLLDRSLPEVSPLVQLRKIGEEDAILVINNKSGWIYVQPQDPASNETWRQRCTDIFKSLFPFFEIVTNNSQIDTPLRRQIIYSMKMFRHGASTGVFGLEFICKWSALEGLVCGGEYSKKSLLTSRIPLLFGKDQKEIEENINKLWDFRNAAVHEANAFDSDYLAGGNVLGPHIEDIERLFLAVVIFAIHHLGTADSVKTLWTQAANYTPHDFVLLKRPNDMLRYSAVNMVISTPFVANNVGSRNDFIFSKLFSENPESEKEAN